MGAIRRLHHKTRMPPPADLQPAWRCTRHPDPASHHVASARGKRYAPQSAGRDGLAGPLRPYLEEAVERCGLQSVVDRHIGKLSRGYRQRVGVAQAVIHRPAVLVLDEPTVGLDPRQIVEIRALIRELAGQATVLLSTHILPEVSVTCGRVLILDRGRLIAEESAEGLRVRSAAGARLRIRARAPRAEAAAAIAALPGIEEVDVEGAAGDPVLALSVATDGALARADAIARCVIERGWRLDEVAPVLPSLEDLFVEILDRAGSGDCEEDR